MPRQVRSRRRLRSAFPRLAVHPQLRGRGLTDLQRDVDAARAFCDRHVRPVALELDRRAGDDPEAFPWDLVAEGGRAGLLDLIMPRPSGGTGDRFCVRTAVVLEEVSAACPGVGTIFGAHALGASPLVLAGPAFWDGVLHDVTTAAHGGSPELMAAAVTEPTAGTDVEHHRHVRTAKLVARARKVRGGYRLSGVKHFISNGSVARWITVMMPTDLSRPSETMSGFLVDARSPGFSIGRVEHKMGQRACPAAELVFDDVFVPADRQIGRVGEGMAYTMGILAGSRPVVGAIATGIARGAYERLLSWLELDPGARPLLEHQQVQLALAEMEEAIHLARQAYLDAATEFDAVSLGSVTGSPAVRMLGVVPRAVRRHPLVRRRMESQLARRLVMRVFQRRIGDRNLARALALSSLAKARGADTAVRVTGLALEIAGLGSGALRPELEKLLRDAKLCQIYEGTNQLNRLEVFDSLVVESSMAVLAEAGGLGRDPAVAPDARDDLGAGEALDPGPEREVVG